MSEGFRRWSSLDEIAQASTFPECPEFDLALSHYPVAEVKRNHDIFVQAGFGAYADEVEFKKKLVLGRWSNRLCSACLTKKYEARLHLCQRCCLVWYCNRECQGIDWFHHKHMCRAGADMDACHLDPKCPYEMVILHVK